LRAVPPYYCLPIVTNTGDFLASYSGVGLAGLRFPGAAMPPTPTPGRLPPQIRAWQRQTAAAVKAVLSGRPPAVLPPLDLAQGTAFQRAVWCALANIPLGQTRSYGEVAATIGRPKAVRAVGSACGANPIPLLIPCHRVLGAHHRLGGFGGGLDWKRKLLAVENIRCC